MRKKRQKIKSKMCFIFTILIISLAFSSISYSHWYDQVEIQCTVSSGCWDSCIKIRKTLEQGCPDEREECFFYMTIEVMNNGSNDLTNVNVTDTFDEMVTPMEDTIVVSAGIAYLTGNDLTWDIGDIPANQIETISICLSINYEDCEFISAVVISPEDGTYVDVPRYSGGTWGYVEYYVEHAEGSRIVKFESNGDNLGDDGEVETDAFIIEALGGGIKVMTATKAGPGYAYVTLYGVGDEETDDHGFIIKLVSIDDLGGGLLKYNITVTSDNIAGKESPSLSHVEFDFGKYCNIEINSGAKVTAKSIWCDLEATTESISIKIDEDGVVISPILPYFTPWVENCCEI